MDLIRRQKLCFFFTARSAKISISEASYLLCYILHLECVFTEFENRIQNGANIIFIAIRVPFSCQTILLLDNIDLLDRRNDFAFEKFLDTSAVFRTIGNNSRLAVIAGKRLKIQFRELVKGHF